MVAVLNLMLGRSSPSILPRVSFGKSNRTAVGSRASLEMSGMPWRLEWTESCDKPAGQVICHLIGWTRPARHVLLIWTVRICQVPPNFHPFVLMSGCVVANTQPTLPVYGAMEVRGL